MAAPAGIRRVDEAVWELPPTFRPGMRVPVRVFATERLLADMDEQVLEQGVGWCRRHGFATDEDLDRTEERGCFAGADAGKVSARALERGRNQLGTLGSGNHYLEIQVAHPAGVADPALAARFGITRPNQVVLMFHCGSRGFGHQVATDYLEVFLHAMKTQHGLAIIDRELACAPFRPREGQNYFAE